MHRIPRFIMNQAVNGVRIFFGISFVMLGLAGLILPIVPGWALIIIGLLILGYKKEVLFIRNKIISFIKWRRKREKDK